MNGFINILKPPGMTSAAVVATLRRLCAGEKAGHAGTLDPEAADFSTLTDTEPVWVDQVKQIARVKVDEQGVEAAAVTLMPAAGAGAPPEDPTICVMDLDRPFLFLIRTGDTVLFVGVVENPG